MSSRGLWSGPCGRDNTCATPRPFLWAARCRAAQAVYPRAIHPGRVPDMLPHPRTLRDLSRGGVCHALAVTSEAVVSYTTFSPLPDPMTSLRSPRGHRRYVLCGTVPLLPVGPNRPGRVGVTHHRAMPCSDFPLRAVIARQAEFLLVRSDRVRIAVALDLSVRERRSAAGARGRRWVGGVGGWLGGKKAAGPPVKVTKRACCVGSRIDLRRSITLKWAGGCEKTDPSFEVNLGNLPAR